MSEKSAQGESPLTALLIRDAIDRLREQAPQPAQYHVWLPVNGEIQVFPAHEVGL